MKASKRGYLWEFMNVNNDDFWRAQTIQHWQMLDTDSMPKWKEYLETYSDNSFWRIALVTWGGLKMPEIDICMVQSRELFLN